MRTGKTLQWVIASALALLVGTVTMHAVSADAWPLTPTIYSGDASVAGQPAPDGLRLHAQIRDYHSEPVTMEGGRYVALVVHPPNDSYDRGIVTFHIDGVKAEEFDAYRVGGLPRVESNFELSFPSLPLATPTPTPVPPTPTRTQRAALPSAYSGNIIIAGLPVPRNAVLVARIGDYESVPAIIANGIYSALVLDPRNIGLLGARVEFFLDGFKSSVFSSYASGEFFRDFDLIFVGIPTPTSTPTPTATPVPPTPTSSPTPTATPTTTPTPVPPTATPTPTPMAVPSTVVPPTAVPPTSTPMPTATVTPPPTGTPVPTATPTPPVPSPTHQPPSPTPVPPTATPRVSTIEPPAGMPQAPVSAPEDVDSGGFCTSTSGHTKPLAGLVNLLALFGPVGLLVVRRRIRRS